MTDTAKVFMSGRSQAVRLPKKYRLDASEVEVSREGDAIVLRPLPDQGWDRLFKALEAFDEGSFEDCFGEGRQQPAMQERPALDDVFG